MKNRFIALATRFIIGIGSAPVILQVLLAAFLIMFAHSCLSSGKPRYQFLNKHFSDDAVFDSKRGVLYYFYGDEFHILDFPAGIAIERPVVRRVKSLSTRTDDVANASPVCKPLSKEEREMRTRETVHNEILALVREENEKYERRNSVENGKETPSKRMTMEEMLAALKEEDDAPETLTMEEMLAPLKEEGEAVDEPFGGAKTSSEIKKWAKREKALMKIGKGKKSYTMEEMLILTSDDVR